MKEKRNLILTIIIFVALIIVVKVSYDYLSKDYALEENVSSSKKDEAKDFIVYDEMGKEVKVSDFKDKKPVVINIWASWCGPCKSEMPYFEEAIKEYEDNIEFLMINLTDGLRETKDKALKYIKDNNFEMKILFDEKLNVSNTYNVSGVPRTIFIDKNGEIIYDRKGTISKSLLDKYINLLLK